MDDIERTFWVNVTPPGAGVKFWIVLYIPHSVSLLSSVESADVGGIVIARRSSKVFGVGG